MGRTLSQGGRYAAGSRLEARIVNEFRAAGWWATRAAGSHGEADVVAALGGTLLLINVKRRALPPLAEWNALVEVAARAGGVPCVARLEGKDVALYRVTGKRAPRVRPVPMLPFAWRIPAEGEG